MSKQIEIENLGPIGHLAFTLEHGINVFVGPNGCGKTHAIDAVKHLALGKGGLPLRDGEKRGFVDGAGARLSIGAKATRSTGEFDTVHLEGKFDLGELVDPQMKSADAADRRRIKSLVQIMGVTADVNRFGDRKIFPEFDKLMPEEIDKHTDLVDQALAVKRVYEEQARSLEGTADRECGKAEALERDAKATDASVETDDKALMARYDAAKEKASKIAAQMVAYGEAKAKEADARKRLSELEQVDVKAANEEVNRTCRAHDDAKRELEELQAKVAATKIEVENLQVKYQAAFSNLTTAEKAAKLIEENERIIAEFSAVANPDPAEVESADKELAAAKAAIEAGAVAREAGRKLEQAKGHRDEEKSLRSKSEAYRAAAKSVDLVLSDAIQCDLLKVESHDGVARLVSYHEGREKYVPFHDLSHGEKWKIALKLGCDRVGEEGVLPISQESWEGIDAFVRPELIAYAKERKVYVLTAEATRNPDDDRMVKFQHLGA